MSDGPGLLEQIGIHIQPAFAGAAGGIVAAWMNKAATIVEWLFYVSCGFLTANFLTKSVMGFANIAYLDEGGVGFCLGAMATLVFWGMTAILKAYGAKWMPQEKRSGDP